ncbi:MAG TPA: ectoine/hydroxyectoine ABC transporter permease subunit EhuD [Burkholderiaceae bacterium]
MTPVFDWAFALHIVPALLRALCVTVEATIAGMLLAVTLGLLLAMARRFGARPLARAATLFVSSVRSTPLLVQIYFLFYVAPLGGIKFPPFATGVLALGLHYSAYCAEVYRAGIESVPQSQWDGASALNFSRADTLARIILPQAIPPVVPALGNYLIAMFKDAPMLSVITVVELLQEGKIIGSETFRYTEPLTLVGAMFLLLSLISAAGVRYAERRLRLPGAA